MPPPATVMVMRPWVSRQAKYTFFTESALPETAENEAVYVAGAKLEDGVLKTNGGRVLGAVAVADDLKSAVRSAYALADRIHFDNAYCRRDIGQRALRAITEA